MPRNGIVDENGAGDGTRTRNLLITNQLLYQLSYAGKTPVSVITTSLKPLKSGTPRDSNRNQ